MAGKTRRNRGRGRGGGYQTPQQFFNPDVLPPHTKAGADLLTTGTAIRPVIMSTFAGGKRSTRRRTRGGFSPSIMGSFLANAQSAIVPLSLYTMYHTMVPKKGRNIGSMSRKRGGRRRAI